MTSQFAKFYALFRLYLSDVFAYKAAAFIWVIGDLHLTLMMPLVWTAVGGVKGLRVDEVATYYVVVMTVSQFVTCHLLWDIAVDIREGAFVSALVRPFSHLSASFARNIAWRFGKLALFLPLLLLLLPVYGRVHLEMLHPSWTFWVALLLGQFVAFLAAYCVAMVALWTTEFVSIFQLYYFPELLLSGRVVPVSALPEWLQRFADVAHFRYTVAFPTEVLMGRVKEPALALGFGSQVAWIVVFWILARLLFSRGVRQYTGFGL